MVEQLPTYLLPTLLLLRYMSKLPIMADKVAARYALVCWIGRQTIPIPLLVLDQPRQSFMVGNATLSWLSLNV